MNSINFTNTDVNSLTVDVDLRIYKQEAVNLALYTFLEHYQIKQQLDEHNPSILHLIFIKSAKNINDQNLSTDFEQELLDCQLRLDLEQRFGHIRDLIVEEAFKPVNNH